MKVKKPDNQISSAPSLSFLQGESSGLDNDSDEASEIVASSTKTGFGGARTGAVASWWTKLSNKIRPACANIMLNERRRTELLVFMISIAVIVIMAVTLGTVGHVSLTSGASQASAPAGQGSTGAPPPPPPTQEPPNVQDPTLPQKAPTYYPGELRMQENGLLISTGLKTKIIANVGVPVVNKHGEASPLVFHQFPDAGACFSNPNGEGGWAYVSNSESGKVENTTGGVGAIYFDVEGNILSYELLLNGTVANCGGGKTPWGTWISCEESHQGSGIWEVDPFNEKRASLTALADRVPGKYESFAYDVRNESDPKFFFTEDMEDGALQRFTPNPDSVTTDPDNMWRMLYDDGYTHEYLVLIPALDAVNGTVSAGGAFRWTNDIDEGRLSASLYYKNTEGIDFRDGFLYFISKTQKELFVLNVDDFTYQVSSTEHGSLSEPDQIIRLFEDSPYATTTSTTRQDQDYENSVLYFTEDGQKLHSGIHGRDSLGRYFTILESIKVIEDEDETTGLAFSPDRRHMYFAMQKSGILYDVWREDGYPFGGMNLDIKYHSLKTNVTRRQ